MLEPWRLHQQIVDRRAFRHCNIGLLQRDPRVAAQQVHNVGSELFLRVFVEALSWGQEALLQSPTWWTNTVPLPLLSFVQRPQNGGVLVLVDRKKARTTVS